MSMKVIVRSSSAMRVAGISPDDDLAEEAVGIGGHAPQGSLPRPMPESIERLRATVEHLAAIERPSASDGEKRAAEWILERLRWFEC